MIDISHFSIRNPIKKESEVIRMEGFAFTFICMFILEELEAALTGNCFSRRNTILA